jgi:hypothetical protein
MQRAYLLAREPKKKRPSGFRGWRSWLVLVCLILAIAAALWRYQINSAMPPLHGLPEFALLQEFAGNPAYANPDVKQNLELGMLNGVTFPAPLGARIGQAARSYRAGLVLRLPAIASVAGIPDSEIEKQRALLNRMAAGDPGENYFWDLMPGWDQSGGKWVPQGRPRYAGLTRSAALKLFQSYYCNKAPKLFTYLQETPTHRRYRFASVTNYSPNVFEAYEMGVDLQLLERGVDDLGDLSTGIAYLRGAAAQYDRPWGINLSTWRTANNGSTNYDTSGKLTGGWSAEYLRRHLYIAYMAGAKAIQIEPSTYRFSNGQLNPFGQAALEFADFALRRHPDVGKPAHSAALIIDPAAGFDPKHGAYDQAPYVWYRDIAYTAGDFMLDNLMRAAYPNHSSFGLAPGAPFANAAGVADPNKFRAYLAEGGDPRIYEPMPFTRWGDNLDVLNTRAPANSLKQYQAILLAGDVQIDAELRTRLADWVSGGGTLVLFGSQLKPDNEGLPGVHILAQGKSTANGAIWLQTGKSQPEPSFWYLPVQPGSAETLVRTNTGYPLITKQRHGLGVVYLVSALYGQSQDAGQLLASTLQLMDSVIAGKMPARVTGPPVEYVVSSSSDKTFVTVANNSSSVWSGQVLFKKPAGDSSAVEYIANQNLPFTTSDSEVTVPVQVAPFDVRVIVLETQGLP